jgi:hypothetical protein
VKTQSNPSVQDETLVIGEDPPPAVTSAPGTYRRPRISALAALQGFTRKPKNLATDDAPDVPDVPGSAQLARPAAPSEGSRFNPWHASVIALIVGVFMVPGLIAVAGADEISVRGGNYSDAVILFFAGLAAIFVPVAIRVLTRNVGRGERFALVLVLGLVFYAVKIMGSPTSFTFIDEYIHLRNTQNILATHHLFGLNPLLPAAAYYPGLGALCAGLVNLTGLSPFVSGLIIIGAARLLICACLFLIAERVTKSSAAAAGASLVYAANPMFLFWSSDFSYENLALPLAAFIIWWISRTRYETSRLITVITVITVVAVTVTHHVSAFALTALLGVWWLADRLFRRSDPGRRRIGAMALLAGSTSLAWFFLVARPAEYYLFGENILPTLQQISAVLSGHARLRHPYSAIGGTADPLWYVLAGFAALALIVLALLPALYRACRIAFGWRQASGNGRRQVNGPLVIAIAMAAAFPVSQLLRLTTDGDVVAARSSEYLFTGLGCVLALLAVTPAQSKRVMAGLRTLLAAGMVTVVLIGAATIGTPYTDLLPEAANPQGYPWMVQPDTIKASEWARDHLGVNQTFAVNYIDSQALATYGEQDTISYTAWPIFLSTTMSDTVVNTIIAEKVRYLFVDWRMTQGIPATPGQYYFSPWEPQAGEYTAPLPAVMLRKFATTDCARLIYSTGLIQIFDVTRIENGSCLPGAATQNAVDR